MFYLFPRAGPEQTRSRAGRAGPGPGRAPGRAGPRWGRPSAGRGASGRRGQLFRASGARVEAELGLGKDEVGALGRRGGGAGSGARNCPGAGAWPGRPLIFSPIVLFLLRERPPRNRPRCNHFGIVDAKQIGQSDAVGAQDRRSRCPGRITSEGGARSYFACPARSFIIPASGELDLHIKLSISHLSRAICFWLFSANLMVLSNRRLSIGKNITALRARANRRLSGGSDRSRAVESKVSLEAKN